MFLTRRLVLTSEMVCSGQAQSNHYRRSLLVGWSDLVMHEEISEKTSCEDCTGCLTINEDRDMWCQKKGCIVHETCNLFEAA
jgi:hypothetical protein